MSLLKRKTTPVGELSPSRLALAEALANLTRIRNEAEGIRSACDASRSSISMARTAIDLAEIGVEEALSAAVQQAVDMARGISGKPLLTVREARNLLQDAQDNLAAVTGMRKALEAKEATDVHLMPRAEHAVEQAAKAVIQVEAAAYAKALVAEVRDLEKALFDRGFALEWLAQIGVFETHTNHGSLYGQPLDEETRRTVLSMRQIPGEWQSHLLVANKAAIWNETLAALMVDASAVVSV